MFTPLIIGIAGGEGSGKTTLARKLLESLDPDETLIIHHESYLKDLAMFGGLSIDKINFDHPATYDTPLFIEHLQNLLKNKSVKIPSYDYANYQRVSNTSTVIPKRIIIIEGILIFTEKLLRDLIDIKIYVDLDPDERVLRKIKRDLIERGRTIESAMHHYAYSVKPMHIQFVEPSKKYADIIVPNGGDNDVAVTMIIEKVRSILKQNE